MAKFLYNPLTGFLDMVGKSNSAPITPAFNPDNIVTALHNSAGQHNMTYDVASGTHIKSSFEVVTDEFGNVVING